MKKHTKVVKGIRRDIKYLYRYRKSASNPKDIDLWEFHIGTENELRRIITEYRNNPQFPILQAKGFRYSKIFNSIHEASLFFRSRFDPGEPEARRLAKLITTSLTQLVEKEEEKQSSKDTTVQHSPRNDLIQRRARYVREHLASRNLNESD